MNKPESQAPYEIRLGLGKPEISITTKLNGRMVTVRACSDGRLSAMTVLGEFLKTHGQQPLSPGDH